MPRDAAITVTLAQQLRAQGLSLRSSDPGLTKSGIRTRQLSSCLRNCMDSDRHHRLPRRIMTEHAYARL
jgi:hypothetical protein